MEQALLQAEAEFRAWLEEGLRITKGLAARLLLPVSGNPSLPVTHS